MQNLKTFLPFFTNQYPTIGANILGQLCPNDLLNCMHTSKDFHDFVMSNAGGILKKLSANELVKFMHISKEISDFIMGNKCMIKVLIQKTQNKIASKGKIDTTPLHLAVHYEHIKLVKLLCKNKTLVYQQLGIMDQDGTYPHFIGLEKSDEMFDILVHHVNWRDPVLKPQNAKEGQEILKELMNQLFHDSDTKSISS